MSRPLTQLLPPDLPAGASPQFSTGNLAGSVLTGGHLNSMASLKTLLQLPIKADQRAKDCCAMKGEVCLFVCGDLTFQLNGCHNLRQLLSGGRPSQSAFLGPHLWERTLPCSDGGLFQLQYMDLEEFLTENGMAMHSKGGNGSSASAQVPSQSSLQSAVPNQSSQCPPSSPPLCSSSSSSMSSSSSSSSLLDLSPSSTTSSSSCLPGPPGGSLVANGTADVMVNFDPDPADVALSSVPGQEAFDPRRHRFSDEELKPQPMIKKARKMLVPDEQKDDKYWSRRYKNNEAAKRSRDARRLKENQITVRAAFLERENAALRQEMADMHKELGRCRNILNKFESRHGDL
uniref:D site albumin promoter binding protein a n=1 Tax=Oncorhynchus mykiss TaxID=8022 RepID=A0A8K9X1N3_ONCMY